MGLRINKYCAPNNCSYFNISAILGSEYCSGYIDSVGKWNTGFYCPGSGSGEEEGDVFCCGTEHHKVGTIRTKCTLIPSSSLKESSINLYIIIQ